MSHVTISPDKARKLIRENKLTRNTSGISSGHVQANLVVVKKELAFDFFLFAQRNPKACPILEVTEVGSYIPTLVAPSADIRTDISKYQVFKNGELTDEPENLINYWEDDMVAFLLGCSYSFENALVENGIPMRHIAKGFGAPAYITNIPCEKAGIFSGPVIVTMRPVLAKDVTKVVSITSQFPLAHGAPISVGSPESIGIKDLNKPDVGQLIELKANEVPVFWACGITPQYVAMNVKPELMITHYPGHMFITDLKDRDIKTII